MKIKQILLSASLLISAVYAQKNIEYKMPAPGDDVIGEIRYVTPNKHESLADLTIRFEMGYEELKWANPGINPWLLNEQRPILLPLQFILPEGKRSGIVSNIPEMRTYYFLKDSDTVYVYPVGVGRMDWKTPLGSWSITRKQENPAWYPPASIRREHEEMGRGTLPGVVPAGPDNPLGTRVLRLSLPSYLLHGTNEQTGIGMRVTHGCMRFYPQHIEQLYDIVPTNTVVTFLNEPIKFGFLGNDLLIEVHPPLDEDNLSVADLKAKALSQLEQYLEEHPNTSVNYDLVNLAVEQQSGVPIIVGQKSSPFNSQRMQSTNSYQNSNNHAPIELYSTPQPYDIPATTTNSVPSSSQSTQNSDIQVITKEVRLTPDPFEVTVPISVPDDQVTFPEPSYPRR
ncbi:hypothetical protein DC083_06640 [Ignatzschineria ureiclastica]|uniref:L,D-TPase catalytic domain-containing protein n=1 Tax=Ignatzschineria ureiclastica TaxID=472582 RepID=A0A2U2ADQ3_9GAMM|nr:L,D-transpeptidase family protein [Ignatzschineria ureiclastica]PWD80783.1 hypothetical protein DC083_06640 [Ignatzschineria ureiclastica]GGZ94701.1 L,D-transpeptidase [Ignatzschineria ureiclastica]